MVSGVAEGIHDEGTGGPTTITPDGLPGDRNARAGALGYAPDEVVFKLREDQGPLQSGKNGTLMQQFARKHKFARTEHVFKKEKPGALKHTYAARLLDGISPLEIVKELQADPAVEWAEPNYYYQAQAVPDDPYYNSSGSWGQPSSDMWGLHALNPENAWDQSRGSGIVIAVIDTGVDYTHEDLYRDSNGNGVLDAGEQYNVWINAGEDINHNGIIDAGDFDGVDDGDGFIDDIRGWNFVSNNNNPLDDHGHGTHVAGIIAAVGNNGRGITGVAPMARIMAVKCLGANGSGSETNLANGIIYAADRGAHIINNSWGGGGQSQLVKSAIDYARSRNCVVTAAAGNSAWNAGQFFPANVPGVLTVGALNTSSSRAYFSNYGSVVSFSAPGVDILSLRAAGTDLYRDGKHFVPSGDANAKYYRSDGTSMACPFASGLAALILGKEPSLSETAVRRAMAASAVPFADPSFYLGTGFLNAESALSVIPQASGVGAAIAQPENDLDPLSTQQSLSIIGTAGGSSYVLEYGQGYYPAAWSTLSTGATVSGGQLGTLDLSDKQGPYHLRLTVGDGSRTAVEHTVLTAEPDLHAGWPVHLGGSSFNFGGFILGSSYTATPADADGDGKDEIFLGTAGYTFGLRGDGAILPGWPTQQVKYPSYGTNGSMPGPSIADMDNDGVMEILWTLRDYVPLMSFNGKKLDGSDMIGFPQQAPGQCSNAIDMPFVLADINDDGMLEAVAAHTYGNTDKNYRISAFDRLGNKLFTHDLADVNESFVALSFGDIDNNGGKDIAGISRAGYQNAPIYLHVLDGSGNEQPGYPVFLYNQTGTDIVSGPPFLADLDNDGDLEVVLGIDGSHSSIRCYHHNGSPVSGFPVLIGNYDTQVFNYSMGDMNGDGVPEIVVLAKNRFSGSYGVYAVSLAGTVLPNFPFGLPEWPTGTPVVVDVDNDGIQDIVFTTYQGSVFAVSGNGQLLNRFPKRMGYRSTSGASVGDVDGDGLFELVTAAMNGSVYVWDLPTPASPANSDWPMRHVSRYNVNVFGALLSANAHPLPPNDPPLPTNNPPFAPTLVFPANGQSGLGTTVTFRWEKTSDPDGDAVAYKLSYCTDQSFSGCDPADVASLDTLYVYYAGFGWPGLLLISMVLAGTVKGRKRSALLIIVVVIITGGIFASCGGDGGGGGWFGVNPPRHPSELSYTAPGLNSGATYYWKVVADDGNGGTSESAVWSFSTQ